jgi:glutamate-1-semialdehyde 2,1-aminomutase
LYDEDGNRLIDYINLGSNDFRSCLEPVVQAVIEKQNWELHLNANRETQIAALAVSMVPNIDKIRFVNSGTEVMSE